MGSAAREVVGVPTNRSSGSLVGKEEESQCLCAWLQADLACLLGVGLFSEVLISYPEGSQARWSAYPACQGSGASSV